MDHFLFEEVYMGLAPSSDVPPLVADVIEADEEWSETHSIEEDDDDVSPSPLVCKICHTVLPRSQSARAHIKLCVYYNPDVCKKASPPPPPVSRKRACAPTDLAEKRTRKRRRVREFEVALVSDYRADNGTFLVSWVDTHLSVSWEPLAHLVDKDDQGQIVRVNAALVSYLNDNDLSFFDLYNKN